MFSEWGLHFFCNAAGGLAIKGLAALGHRAFAEDVRAARWASQAAADGIKG